MKKLLLIFAVLLMTDLIAAKENQTVKLNSGYEMPTLGLAHGRSLAKLVKTPFMPRSNLAID